MLWGVQWYYWLILLAAIVLLIFVWRKASIASKERRERMKKEAAIWKRDYDLRQNFTVLTAQGIKETEESELLHGIAMNIQVALENATDMTTAFEALPQEKKFIYALEYFDEDAKKSLSAFFKNNGAPLTPVIPDALEAIGAEKYISLVKHLSPMYDPDSDVSIDYGEIKKTDEEFASIYDSDGLCRLAAAYIRKNIEIFL